MPSEQGMLGIGARGVDAMQHSDRYLGTESTTANTAVQQQRGAAALNQLMGYGNCLHTSPQQQSHAISVCS